MKTKNRPEINAGSLLRFKQALQNASGYRWDHRFKRVQAEGFDGEDWIIANFGDSYVVSDHINGSMMAHPDDDADLLVTARNEGWAVFELLRLCYEALAACETCPEVEKARQALDLAMEG